MRTIDVHITNQDLYLATEWNIITAMQRAESALAKVAVQATKDVRVEVDRRIPVEGYYGMNLGFERDVDPEALKEFFFAIRALQNGRPVGPVTSESLRRLDNFYHSPAFGMGPARPTPIHPNPPYGWAFETPEARYISGVIDGVYKAVMKVGWNTTSHNTQAALQELVKLQEDGKLGTDLVALATLVDSLDHKYNGKIDPICLTYSLFTTVLSREIPCTATNLERKFHWDVNSRVENLADAVVVAYNDAISKVLSNSSARIKSFHSQDAQACYYAVEASDTFLGRNRIVRVSLNPMLGHLHWLVRHDPELKRYAAFSLVSPEIIDPNQYKNDQTIINKYNPQRAVDVSSVPAPLKPEELDALLRAIKKKLAKK